MNKQIIEIEVPEGKKAIWKDGKVVFEDIFPKLPETWEEFCELYHTKVEEVFINSDSQLIYWGWLGQRHCLSDKNLLPSLEAAKSHLASMQLHQLRDCYRQGWVPDWYNKETEKYNIEFSSNKYFVFRCYTSHRFLSFQSKEIAEKFLTNFEDLIEQAGDLI